MRFSDWYTDTVDVYRATEKLDGSLVKYTREMVYEGIPCRVYEDSSSPVRMSQDAASVSQNGSLALDNQYDIHAGDELIIYRGGMLGNTDFKTRAFAGDPHHHFEPFGAVRPGLSHQEIKLLQEDRL